MSQEGQPRDARITFYIPENWLPLSPEEGGQQFINFPVSQTANILFPGSISCSNLESFAPSALARLFNNSTTGNIEIANNSGYTGGIVINSNAVAPVANTIRIGDSNRPVIMPKVKLTDIEPNMMTVAGVPVILPVFINSDTTIASGKQLLVNEIKPATFARVSLPDGATTLKPEDTDTSNRIVTSQWVRNQGFTTTAGFVTYNGLGPFTVLQTFDLGVRTNTITLLSASNLSLPPSVTDTPSIPNNTALVPTCNWVNTTITNALNVTTLFAKLAGTAAFTALQTFNTGIKTNSIALVSGSTLSLPNILTNSIGLVSGSTLSLPNILTNSIGLVSGTTLSLPNILTNSIGLVSGTTLSLPAATTTAPPDDDTSTRVVNSQWVRNQGYVSAIASDVTYNGVGPFTTMQTFTSGIKTDSIVLNSASSLSLPASTTTTPAVPDDTTKVPTCNWVNTTIDNALNNTTLFAKLAGTAPFTALQTFTGIKTDSIVLNAASNLSLPVSTTTTPTVPDNTTLVPTTAWVNTTITNAINAITGFATYAGTTAFTALQTFNGGVTINSASPLTITASTASETYNSGGPSAPTMKVLTGNTAGASALSTTFYRYSVAGSGTVEPLRIFTTTATTSVATCQYMELTVSGILTRSPGSPNIFSTKATFVIHNFNNNDAAGQIAMVNLAYPTQYSSNSNVATISVSTPTTSELRISITINKGNVVRQNLVATLVAYPSMGAAGANNNFTITAPAF